MRKRKIKYTREEKREFRKKNRNIGLFSSVIVGMFLVATVYFILNLLKLSGIETEIRYIVIALLVILMLLVIRKNFKLRVQPKKYKFILFILLLIIIGYGEIYVSTFISKGISAVDNLNKSKNKVTYTSALIALKDSEVTTKNIDEVKIGIISDEDDTEGYVLAKTLIKKHKIKDSNLVEFDSYITMLTDLYDEKIEAAFVSGSYVSKYSGIEKFENIESDVKVIDKYSKVMKKQSDRAISSSTKSVTEPFTLLLLGVDSPEEDINDAVALGDTIMVVTFNPNTLNATLFSIPRDTYVPITCYGNAMSKITHSSSGGDSCIINTVENFIDIDIDYYAKVNFKGLIKLVDALGGIDVDVPYSFCETDENRMLANTVFVEKGHQHLTGLQALALSRNRKYYPTCGEEWNEGTRSDFVRGQNQQLVLKAILAKAKKIRTVDDFYKVLDTISKNLDTNLTREQILGFYNIFKKILLSTDSLTDDNDVISIQRTYLNGSDGIIMDYVAGTGLYEFIPSSQSLDAIVTAMKVNLEMEEEEYATSFSFSIDEPYEAEIIGSDLYGGVKSYPRVNTSEEEETKVKCSTNEELGADKKTCLCKSGYSKNSSGKCVKDEEEEEKEETEENTCTNGTMDDGENCVCWAGYEKDSSGVCNLKEEETPEETNTETPETPEENTSEENQ